jgi:hypothetical protein
MYRALLMLLNMLLVVNKCSIGLRLERGQIVDVKLFHWYPEMQYFTEL